MNATTAERYVQSIDLGSDELKAAPVGHSGRILASANEHTGAT